MHLSSVYYGVTIFEIFEMPLITLSQGIMLSCKGNTSLDFLLNSICSSFDHHFYTIPLASVYLLGVLAKYTSNFGPFSNLTIGTNFILPFLTV